MLRRQMCAFLVMMSYNRSMVSDIIVPPCSNLEKHLGPNVSSVLRRNKKKIGNRLSQSVKKVRLWILIFLLFYGFVVVNNRTFRTYQISINFTTFGIGSTQLSCYGNFKWGGI